MSDQTDPLFLAIEGTRPSLPTDAERERSIAAVLDAALPQRARRGWLGWTLREFPVSAVLRCGGLPVSGDAVRRLVFGTGRLGCGAEHAAAGASVPRLSSALPGVAPPDHVEGIHERHAGMEANLPRAVAEGHGGADVRVRRRIGGGVRGDVCRAVAASNRALPFAWMLGVSFSSLFLYAALSLAVQRARRRWALFAVPAAWVVLGAVLLRWEGAATLLLGSHLRVLAGGVLCPAALLGRGQALGNVPSRRRRLPCCPLST